MSQPQIMLGRSTPVYTSEWTFQTADQEEHPSTNNYVDSELIYTLSPNTKYLIEIWTKHRHVSSSGFIRLYTAATITRAYGVAAEYNHTGETTPVSQDLEFKPLLPGDVDSGPATYTTTGSSGSASSDRGSYQFILDVGSPGGNLIVRHAYGTASADAPFLKGAYMRVRVLP